MNISEEKRISDFNCKFSADGKYFALVNLSTVHIYNTISFTSLRTCRVREKIDYLSWSPNSLYFMCGIRNMGAVYAWSIEDPKWMCKITEGSIGLVTSFWSPDSMCIITVAGLKVRMTIWSLKKDEALHTKCIKNLACCKFSKDGKRFAFIDTSSKDDMLCISSCSTWSLLQKFSLPSKLCEGIEWSPDSEYIAIWDGITEFHLHIYSVLGKQTASLKRNSQIGIEMICWSPSSQFLTIASADAQLFLVNNVTWNMLNLTQDTLLYNDDILLLRETVSGEAFTSSLSAEGILPEVVSQYEKYKTEVSKIDYPLKDKSEWSEISWMSYSSDGQLLAHSPSIYPNLIYIWNATNWTLTHVLSHLTPLKCITWDPVQTRLGIAANNNKVYFWTPSDTAIILIPDSNNFKIQNIEWSHSGTSMLVNSRDKLRIIYLTN